MSGYEAAFDCAAFKAVSFLGKERERMRFMITFRVPTEKGNAAVRDGTLPDNLQSVLDDLEPEAAYFSDIEGARGGYLVVNMDDASQIPAVAEPLFPALDATVQVHPVFTPEDMPRAMEGLQRAAQKYGQVRQFEVGWAGTQWLEGKFVELRAQGFSGAK